MQVIYFAALTRHAKQLYNILSEVNNTLPDIEASGLMSKEGLPLALTPPQAFDEDKLGGLAAALLSLSDKSGEDLYLGPVEQVVVTGRNGSILITHAGEDTFLVVVAKPGADLDLIFSKARRAVAGMQESA
jgi:predicted regulator of Ras-like GTPase activity (Roadblock/LC7/MglB family)